MLAEREYVSQLCARKEHQQNDSEAPEHEKLRFQRMKRPMTGSIAVDFVHPAEVKLRDELLQDIRHIF